MIIGDHDLGGASNPFLAPVAGTDRGDVLVYNAGHIAYPKGAVFRDMPVKFWVRAWQGLGGQAANSFLAVQLFIKQLEELASNPFHNPTYIRWSSTADPTGYNASDPHDGWYEIVDFKPNYASFIPSGWVECSMKATLIAPGPPRPTQYALFGGTLSTNFTGAGLSVVAFPLNSTTEASFTRSGAEGAIPMVLSPAANPEPVGLSATVGDWFKGGCHVYDTITAGGNAVPTTGAFTHANWVEVFYTDHDFQGDCIITNGLHLYRFQTSVASQVGTCYLWSTAQATPGWLQFATLAWNDSGFTLGTIRSFALQGVGMEEVRIVTRSATGAGNWGEITLRLQRGQYFCRTDLRPLSQASVTGGSLWLGMPVVNYIFYNSTHLLDAGLAAELTGLAPPTDYGYGAAFIKGNAAYPYVFGWLYQNAPGIYQPYGFTADHLLNGDNTSLAQNAQRSYGIFAIPYGVSGSYSTANLQVEAEAGALGTGWSSVADAAASAGNAAKCASGTVAGNADDFNSNIFVPAPGTYDVWFHMKVTTNVGSALEMTVGLWDSTLNVWMGSTTFNRTALTTSYAWYRAATGVTPTAGNLAKLRAVTALTLGTDWFIDEGCLVPKTLTTAKNGPQDIFQQFINDVTQELVVA